MIFFLASLPLTGGDRSSLLSKNISIYSDFGKALTYALMASAPSISRKNFFALNTTDHNRARSIALRICRERCS